MNRARRLLELRTSLAAVMGSLLLLTLALAAPIEVESQTLKIGTVAPQGSPWADALQQMAAVIARGSSGTIDLRIYAGGVAGDEADMLRKARVGQIEGLALTSRGLSHLYPSILGLMLPLHFQSESEFDYVFEHLRPRLEAEVEQRGFHVLAWSFTGWVYLFAREPVVQVDDLRRQRLWVWSVQPEEVSAWQAAGFDVVSLPVSEISTALQTGLLDAVLQSPPYAAATQLFGIATHMADLQFSPLFGAVIVTNRAWQRLNQQQRELVQDAATASIQGLPADIDQRAIEVMQRYGLEVNHVPLDEKENWVTASKASADPLVGTVIDRDLYESILHLLEEHRAGAR